MAELCMVAHSVCGCLSGELALCHASGAYIMEVAGVFFEILLTLTIVISKIMRHVRCITLYNLGGSNKVE